MGDVDARALLEGTKKNAEAWGHSEAGKHAKPERGASSSSNDGQVVVYTEEGIDNQSLPAMPLQRDALQGHQIFDAGGTPSVGLSVAVRPAGKHEIQGSNNNER